MRPEPRSGLRRSPFSSISWRSRPRAPGLVPRIQQDGYLSSRAFTQRSGKLGF